MEHLNIEGVKVLVSLRGGKAMPILFEDFPKQYDRYHTIVMCGTYESTTCLEEEGEHVLNGYHSMSDDLINEFVRSVFRWGGKISKNDRPIRRDVYREQTKKQVASVFKEMCKCLLLTDPMEEENIKAAICKITSLKNLGDSYGSKILRMLSPQNFVALDSVLQDGIWGKRSTGNRYGEEYVEWCSDCRKVAKHLNDHTEHKHPRGEWYAADVESVIYHNLSLSHQRLSRLQINR